MTQFGTSRFGSGAQFGGSITREQRYYRLFKELRPPGVYSDDDSTYANNYLRTDAVGVGNKADSAVHGLENETFPHSAYWTLALWEAMYDITPPEHATIAERQNTCLAHWRMRLGSRPIDIRKILATIIQPTLGFRDEFNVETEFGEWWTTDIGAGTIDRYTSGGIHYMRFNSSSPTDCDWTDVKNNAPLAYIPVVDRDDGFTIEARVTSASSTADRGAGVMIYEDRDNALMWHRLSVAGVFYNQLDELDEDNFTRNVVRTYNGASAVQYLRIVRDGKTYTFQESTDGTTWADAYEMESEIEPRYVGVYGRNAGAYPAINWLVDYFKVWYDTTHNNVEIHEFPLELAQTPGAGLEDEKFRAFVHIHPEDGNTSLVETLQRMCDRIKPGHTLLTVGLSDAFLTDDEPNSLTDRDVLVE